MLRWAGPLLSICQGPLQQPISSVQNKTVRTTWPFSLQNSMGFKSAALQLDETLEAGHAPTYLTSTHWPQHEQLLDAAGTRMRTQTHVPWWEGVEASTTYTAS